MSKKKKKASKKDKRKVVKLQAKTLKALSGNARIKDKCCKKYKKGEHKRCGKCPCFDLIKKVA